MIADTRAFTSIFFRKLPDYQLFSKLIMAIQEPKANNEVFKDRRDMMVGWENNFVDLKRDVDKHVVTAYIGAPNSGKTWMLEELARKYSTDTKSRYLVGYHEANGQEASHFESAVERLYDTWLKTADWAQQVRMIKEFHDQTKISPIWDYLPQVFLNSFALKILTNIQKSLRNSNVTFSENQGSKLKRLVKTIQKISEKELVLVMDSFGAASSSLAKDISILRGYLKDDNELNIKVVLGVQSKELNVQTDKANSDAIRLINSELISASCYKARIHEVKKLDIAKDIEFEKLQTIFSNKHNSKLSKLKIEILNRGKEKLLEDINGFPGTIKCIKDAYSNEFHLAEIIDRGREQQYFNLTSELKKLEGEDLNFAICLALVPELEKKSWTMIQEILPDFKSNNFESMGVEDIRKFTTSLASKNIIGYLDELVEHDRNYSPDNFGDIDERINWALEECAYAYTVGEYFIVNGNLNEHRRLDSKEIESLISKIKDCRKWAFARPTFDDKKYFEIENDIRKQFFHFKQHDSKFYIQTKELVERLLIRISYLRSLSANKLIPTFIESPRKKYILNWLTENRPSQCAVVFNKLVENMAYKCSYDKLFNFNGNSIFIYGREPGDFYKAFWILRSDEILESAKKLNIDRRVIELLTYFNSKFTPGAEVPKGLVDHPAYASVIAWHLSSRAMQFDIHSDQRNLKLSRSYLNQLISIDENYICDRVKQNILRLTHVRNKHKIFSTEIILRLTKDITFNFQYQDDYKINQIVNVEKQIKRKRISTRRRNVYENEKKPNQIIKFVLVEQSTQAEPKSPKRHVP